LLAAQAAICGLSSIGTLFSLGRLLNRPSRLHRVAREGQQRSRRGDSRS
jgi:hypothetical protein